MAEGLPDIERQGRARLRLAGKLGDRSGAEDLSFDNVGP